MTKQQDEVQTFPTQDQTLAKVDASLLRMLYKEVTREAAPAKQEKLIEDLLQQCLFAGCDIFVEKTLSKEKNFALLKSITADFRDDEKLSQKATVKLLKEKINKTGFSKILESLKAKTLDKIQEALGFSSQEDDPSDQKMNDILDELEHIGFKEYLEVMKKPYLERLAKDIGRRTDGRKADIIQRIVRYVFQNIHEPNANDLAPTEEEQEEEEEEEEKPVRRALKFTDIKKGITKAELSDFGVDALRKYLEKKGLKKSGTKSEMIKRIIAFVEDGVTEEKKKTKKPKLTEEEKEEREEQRKREQEAAAEKIRALKRKAVQAALEATANSSDDEESKPAAKKQRTRA